MRRRIRQKTASAGPVFAIDDQSPTGSQEPVPRFFFASLVPAGETDRLLAQQPDALCNARRPCLQEWLLLDPFNTVAPQGFCTQQGLIKPAHEVTGGVKQGEFADADAEGEADLPEKRNTSHLLH